MGFVSYLIFKLYKSTKLMFLMIAENSTVTTYPFSFSSTDYLIRFVMNFTYHARIPIFKKRFYYSFYSSFSEGNKSYSSYFIKGGLFANVLSSSCDFSCFGVEGLWRVVVETLILYNNFRFFGNSFISLFFTFLEQNPHSINYCRCWTASFRHFVQILC